jgi:hypothetical protein
MNRTQYRAWRQDAVEAGISTKMLRVIDSAYDGLGTRTKAVAKPYLGTLGADGKRTRHTAPLGQPATPSAAKRVRPCPSCYVCGAKTLHVDDAWRPVCPVSHGVKALRRPDVPDSVTPAMYGVWQQIEQAVDDAFNAG